MIVSVGLTRLIGSEIIRYDGVDGVFIPIAPNGDETVSFNGERDVFIRISLNPNKGKRNFDYSGRLMTPKSQTDAAISSPDSIGKGVMVAWGFSGYSKKMSKLVTSSDFATITKD